MSRVIKNKLSEINKIEDHFCLVVSQRKKLRTTIFYSKKARLEPATSAASQTARRGTAAALRISPMRKNKTIAHSRQGDYKELTVTRKEALFVFGKQLISRPERKVTSFVSVIMSGFIPSLETFAKVRAPPLRP